jgi:hypothetical protein
MNEKRKRLLVELEDIVGSEFYNGNIQNWGATYQSGRNSRSSRPGST